MFHRPIARVEEFCTVCTAKEIIFILIECNCFAVVSLYSLALATHSCFFDRNNSSEQEQREVIRRFLGNAQLFFDRNNSSEQEQRGVIRRFLGNVQLFFDRNNSSEQEQRGVIRRRFL